MRTLFERLRSLVIWIVALPFFLAACVVVWLGSFVLRGRHLENLIKGGCRAVLFVCGIRVRVSGLENLVPGRQSTPAPRGGRRPGRRRRRSA